MNEYLRRVEERRTITVLIDVESHKFHDHKEIVDLFNYMYEKSVLNDKYHFKNTFKIEYITGDTVGSFSVSVDADYEYYDELKQVLDMLVDSFDMYKREYIRFKQFGTIESHALMRKGIK